MAKGGPLSKNLTSFKVRDPGSWGISMKLEQNRMTFTNTTGTNTGYIDLARSLSALNGKSVTQTKRGKNKKGQHVYKPRGFLVRIRALAGTISYKSANCGYPTRNAVVLAGHARDEMLESAGVSRGNLETYQKELRLKFECDQTEANLYLPGAEEIGAEGNSLSPRGGDQEL